MREEYRKTINELLNLPEETETDLNGNPATVVVNLMLCKRLDRIADILQGIDQDLESITNHLLDIELCQ